jgi:predicted alpha/beta-hydrolase family hydrolase
VTAEEREPRAEDPERIAVELPSGMVEIPADYAAPAGASATMAIAHGAGAGRTHPFLTGFATGMREHGVATLLFDFPYRAAGRRMPGPAAHAVATWRAVEQWLARHGAPAPVWAAGKSYGGRMASMAAADGAIAPAGLAYLGYPLHPPGEPAKARVAHLPQVRQPQLFVSGTSDPFVDPHAQLEDAVAACADAHLEWIEGGAHSFEGKGRPRDPAVLGAGLAPLVAAFLRARS